MKVTEFKLWFKGMTAGMVAGQGLSAGQLEAIKKEVNNLESDDQIHDVKGTDKTPLDVSPPAKGLEELVEEIRKYYDNIPPAPKGEFVGWPGHPGPDFYWTLPEDLLKGRGFRN